MVAVDAARLPVIRPEREDGQTQFIVRTPPAALHDRPERATGISPRTTGTPVH
ncbi:hypothetical protein [Streptomyces sp. NPDC048612]|uniref:hypothetical protein n=1 Tax=Streptomyces sp. NPDC048612 TaxID=3365579 RepID=UPI00371EC812